ncbi:hypothetical protein Q5M86_03625 [Brachyspira innocens]|uniref:Uncharacterized protein n=2 Tax=Brachyspira innocens TaxID=13264 RepID=A0ABT8YW73_9SPIR|nr:hypothetical protein [Brachyspira innocens]MDO7019861.1 hypothetical protein [Brachyspira innocens]
MIKKISFISATIIQVLFVISAFALQFLSKKKMGVMRHFVYYNKKIETIYNMPFLINAVSFIVLIIIILTAIVFFYFLKSKIYNNKYMMFLNISLFVLGILFIIFLRMFSRESLLAYYYMALIFFIVYIAELIKTSFYYLFIKKSKKY